MILSYRLQSEEQKNIFSKVTICLFFRMADTMRSRFLNRILISIFQQFLYCNETLRAFNCFGSKLQNLPRKLELKITCSLSVYS